jgi:hypothetical protein
MFKWGAIVDLTVEFDEACINECAPGGYKLVSDKSVFDLSDRRRNKKTARPFFMFHVEIILFACNFFFFFFLSAEHCQQSHHHPI